VENRIPLIEQCVHVNVDIRKKKQKKNVVINSSTTYFGGSFGAMGLVIFAPRKLQCIIIFYFDWAASVLVMAHSYVVKCLIYLEIKR